MTKTLPGHSLRAMKPVLFLLFALFTHNALAQHEALFETLDISGRAGLGFALRSSDSPYRDVNAEIDLMPIYVYEGDRFYLHSYRAGALIDTSSNTRLDLFVARRFEGFPNGRLPDSLTGMDAREPQLDAGASLRIAIADLAELKFEFRKDISERSYGGEIMVGLGQQYRHGALALHPYTSITYRDSDLNNYYYGVRASEQLAGRPEYFAGAGFNFEAGLYAQYQLTLRWKLLAGAGLERLSSEIKRSPIVDHTWLVSGYVGAAYDFDDEPTLWARGKPVLVRVFRGASSDCNLTRILSLTCLSVDTADHSRVTGVHLGRTLMKNVNGLPLDFIGYVGILYRDDRGNQENSWQGDAYIKAQWHQFPWNDWLRTRIGFGAGISLASDVPYVERRDQANRNRNTSTLLNYLDPSVDINLGDLFGNARLDETWFGFGVSHRSGGFASSALLGNVNGGSNYIYTHIETSF